MPGRMFDDHNVVTLIINIDDAQYLSRRQVLGTILQSVTKYWHYWFIDTNLSLILMAIRYPSSKFPFSKTFHWNEVIFFDVLELLTKGPTLQKVQGIHRWAILISNQLSLKISNKILVLLRVMSDCTCHIERCWWISRKWRQLATCHKLLIPLYYILNI